ncbi:MAG: hypothetical protein ABJN36_06640 [Cyclobacteriaceae bacterium]|uniref:hypothetical protein n=1 Tax=Nonlabens ulvanivorans TaxID=906888 RepID=UPI00327AA6C0
MSNKKHNETILFLKNNIFWFAALTVAIGLLIVLFFLNLEENGELTIQMFASGMVKDLIITFISLLFFGFFYQIYSEKEARKIRIEETAQAIQGDLEVLDNFPQSLKQQFIRNGVISLLGQNQGSKLYDQVINNYLDDGLLCRNKFRYIVEIQHASELFFAKLTGLEQGTFYALDEKLSCSKHFLKNKVDKKDITFKIAFARDEKSLEYWLNDDHVFMREVIGITQWEDFYHSHQGGRFTKETFLESIELHVMLENKDGSKSLNICDELEMKIINDEKEKLFGIELALNKRFDFADYLFEDEDSFHYKSDVSFIIPYSKKMNRFHFIISQPTQSPYFQITYPPELKVDYLPYSQVKDKLNPHVINQRTISVESSDIVFPRSGVVFYWT